MSISPSSFYLLTNNYTGPHHSLKVNPLSGNSHLLVANDDSTSNVLYWQFNFLWPTTKYHICTEYAHSIFCLDIKVGDKTAPHLAVPAYDTGSFWSAQKWGDGTWKLTNDYSGPELHLDVYSNTRQAFMGDGDHTGQHWTLTPVEKPEPGCPRSAAVQSTNTSFSFQPFALNARIVTLVMIIALLVFGSGKSVIRRFRAPQLQYVEERKVALDDA